MGQRRRKTLSALLSFVLLIPMHIVSVSAEDTEPEVAEEIQQISESPEDEQPEMTTEEDQDSELQENEDTQDGQEEQTPEQPESEISDQIIEEEDSSEAAEDEEKQEISDENVTEFTEEESSIGESQSQDDIPEEDSETDNNSEEEQEEPSDEIEEPSILYQLHLSNVGWTQNYKNGETSAEGRIEAFRITTEDLDGQIVYQSHVQNIGWMSEVFLGAISGTTGQNRQIEAIRISLSGEAANEYDVAYRVKIREYGWTGWALNGEQCGSEGYSLSLLSMELKLVPKGSIESDASACFFQKSGMTIQANIQKKGWLKAVGNGNVAGTTGQSLRMEALRVSLPSDLMQLGDIEAYAHVSNIGWTGPAGSGQMIGTTGQSRSIEAIRISLTGQLAELYDIRYRVHVRNIGWLNYAFNGDTAGTVGYGLPVEAVDILLEKLAKDCQSQNH